MCVSRHSCLTWNDRAIKTDKAELYYLWNRCELNWISVNFFSLCLSLSAAVIQYTWLRFDQLNYVNEVWVRITNLVSGNCWSFTASSSSLLMFQMRLFFAFICCFYCRVIWENTLKLEKGRERPREKHPYQIRYVNKYIRFDWIGFDIAIQFKFVARFNYFVSSKLN